ncbi:MAG TPA: SLC13 family permease, partial [Steroidobacteraceae bacterium]
MTGFEISGIPFEFLLFAATLLGVALFHGRTLQVAIAGLTAIVIYKLAVAGFHGHPGLAGLLRHLRDEWVVLANLFALLMGFALLSRHFEQSHVPGHLPRLLPDDWKGGFMLLVLVFVLSSFLDNIAAALIGGTVAASVFHRRLHIGYVAGIVAASNAGGSGSVVGDTTTTMMWIDGVSPLNVVHAYVAASVALVVCGVIAARQQQAYSPIQKQDVERAPVDWLRVGVVAGILLAAIGVNVLINVRYPELAARFPFIGAAVWVALLAGAVWRRPDWSVLPSTLRGTVFLLCLVLSASLMPVERLPAASWQTAFGLGFVSAVFDNIPLTKLALEQGGYDWGMLAYAV